MAKVLILIYGMTLHHELILKTQHLVAIPYTTEAECLQGFEDVRNIYRGRDTGPAFEMACITQKGVTFLESK